MPIVGEPVEDVVGDPVALLLAQQDLAGEPELSGYSLNRSRSRSETRWTLRADSSNSVSSSRSGLGLAGHIPFDSRQRAWAPNGRSQPLHGAFTGR
jgi:hypothetical protein